MSKWAFILRCLPNVGHGNRASGARCQVDLVAADRRPVKLFFVQLLLKLNVVPVESVLLALLAAEELG